MTSKTSSVKINPARKMLRFTLKKQTPITLLVTAFTLFSAPAPSFVRCWTEWITYPITSVMTCLRFSRELLQACL